MSIPDDVCSPWGDGLWSSLYSAVSTSCDPLPVSPRVEDEDDTLSFAFVFEDAEEGRGAEKSIQLVTPKRMSSLLPVCTPSPSPSPSPSPTPFSLPASAPLVPLRPPRCSTMTSISSLPFPPCPITDEFAGEDEDDERRYGLKSRWSSSTLGEEYEASSLLNASKKLRTYFRGAKRTTPSSSPPATTKISIPIPSPIRFRGKGQKENKNKNKKKAARNERQGLMIIRPQDSFLPRVEEELEVSSGRSLRRKPIPEEMLVRTG